MLDNPVVFKDADHVAVWMYLLLNATHKECQVLFKGEKITLLPGQLITGRKTIADFLGISESKVKRVLLDFESDQQIDRQRSNRNSLISLINWNKYQICDQQNGQPVTSRRPAGDQQKVEKRKKSDQPSDQLLTSENGVNSTENADDRQQYDQQNGQSVTSRENENSQKVTTNNNITINNNTLLCAPAEARENVSDLDTGCIQDVSEPEQSSAPDKKTALEQDREDFEIIYKVYPKKRGKSKAFEHYRGFVGKGRKINGTRYKLDRRQIYLAVAAYVQEKEEAGTDLQFYQDFSTFMCKTILDYLPEKEDTT